MKIIILAFMFVLSACGPGEYCVSRTCVKIDNCQSGLDDWEPATVFCDVHWETGEIVQWREGEATVGTTYQFCGPSK